MSVPACTAYINMAGKLALAFNGRGPAFDLIAVKCSGSESGPLPYLLHKYIPNLLL